MSHQIRLQLETLLAEKARLAQENSVYTRENRFLREIVEYHQLTMQDVVYLDENSEEVTEVYPIKIPSQSFDATPPPTPTPPQGAIPLMSQNSSSLDLKEASQTVIPVNPYVQMPSDSRRHWVEAVVWFASHLNRFELLTVWLFLMYSDKLVFVGWCISDDLHILIFCSCEMIKCWKRDHWFCIHLVIKLVFFSCYRVSLEAYSVLHTTTWSYVSFARITYLCLFLLLLFFKTLNQNLIDNKYIKILAMPICIRNMQFKFN